MGRYSERILSMHLRLAKIFAMLALIVAAPCLHAGTITFDYTDVMVPSFTGSIPVSGVSGIGSFSYDDEGSGGTIALRDLTSFTFELDISNPGGLPNPIIFDYNDGAFFDFDLLSFSADVSGGGVLTALSLRTIFINSNDGQDDDEQVDLVVTSLGSGGAATFNYFTIIREVQQRDTGTIIQITPEPSTALLAGGGALLL